MPIKNVHIMTEEQKNNTTKASYDFGNIPINPHGSSGKNKQQEPETGSSERRPKKKNSTAPSDGTESSQKTPDPPSSKKKTRLCCILLLLPVILFLLYLAGAQYLLPRYIKGPLAEQLSKRLNRPVTIRDAAFSPFSFDLHLGGIEIGADQDRPNETEPKFGSIVTLDTRLRLRRLLEKKIVFEHVRIEGMRANLTRYPDGTYTELTKRKNSFEPGSINALNILPPWLQLLGLHLTDSAIVFHDQINDRQHLVEQIECTLPSAESRQKPVLHAVVNGSPVLIQGERDIREDGQAQTRLSLQLDNIDPQKYLAWIPGINDSLQISTDRTDATLEIILQNGQGAETGALVSGAVSISGLRIDASGGEKANGGKTVQLAAPKAELEIRANPLQHLYTVENLVLEQPKLVLPDKGKN
ncbi:MAG: AsmA family protein, partial [Gammaproteobacteria bacterium]|nr:AsmA family protein [Gammaproteobacteria bacterium]